MAEAIHNRQEFEDVRSTFIDAVFRFVAGPRRQPLLARHVPGLVGQSRLPKSPRRLEPDQIIGMFAELPCEHSEIAITIGASVLYGDTFVALRDTAAAQRPAGYGYVPPVVYPASFNVLFVYPKDAQEITEETTATFRMDASPERHARVIIEAPAEFLSEGHPVRGEILAMGIREDDLQLSGERGIHFSGEAADSILRDTVPFISNILADYSLS